MDLPTMRTKVRRDLRDTDPADYRWSDDEIDRHVNHTLLDISQAVPQEKISEGLVIPTPASKDIDISSLNGLILVDGVEYPTLEDPKRWRSFRVWAGTLTLLIDETVTADEPLNVYYSAAHTIAADACTLPPHMEDLCSMGTSAYAAYEWAAYAVNVINVGGERTAADYLKWAQDRLEVYQKELKRYGRQSRLKIGKLYAD
ncbi:MAG: hypothetical protein U9R04_05660 [Chloroflexota bacterium]|nr:hypothetical protein [Chloroflexota bacterium]